VCKIAKGVCCIGARAEMSNYFPKKENTDEKLLDYTPLLRFSDDVLVLLEIGTASQPAHYQ
jgi:hypothetical protein